MISISLINSINDFFFLSNLLLFISIFAAGTIALDFIQILIYLEIAFLCLNVNFILTSVLLDDLVGQIFSIFILSTTAAESAIILSIIIIFYRLSSNIDVKGLFFFSCK